MKELKESEEGNYSGRLWQTETFFDLEELIIVKTIITKNLK